MAVLKIRNSTDTGWIILGGAGGCEVTQSDTEPASPYAGMLWLDTDAGSQEVCTLVDSYDFVGGETGWSCSTNVGNYGLVRVVGQDLLCSSSGYVVGIQLSEDLGVTWNTNYNNYVFYWTGAGNGNANYTDSTWWVAYESGSSTNFEGYFFDVLISCFNRTGITTGMGRSHHISGPGTNQGSLYNMRMTGGASAEVYNRLQVRTSGGTFIQGRVSVYGMRDT